MSQLVAQRSFQGSETKLDSSTADVRQTRSPNSEGASHHFEVVQTLQRVHVDTTGRKAFDCPDFAGDHKLEACLNDDDRLGPGECGLTVVKVQRALLHDGEGLGPDGADGVYGPATGRAVMAFKSKYHLGFEQFPDVGPGTMAKLDELCGGGVPPTPVPPTPVPPTPVPVPPTPATFPPSINFWINAFIPVTMPGAIVIPAGPFAGQHFFPGPPHPFHRNSCFETDERVFTPSPAAAASHSRIQINATVNTTTPPSLTSSLIPGATDEIDCTTGAPKCHRIPTFLTVVSLVGAPGNLIVLLVSTAGNDPCVSGSPDLSLRGLITIDRIARTLSFSGAATLFPAFEMYADFGSGPVPIFIRPPVVNSVLGLLAVGGLAASITF